MRITNNAAFAREWVESFNAHNLPRLLSHYSDDIERVSPIAAERLGRSDGCVRGKADLAAYFACALAPGSALRFALRKVYPGVNSIVLEYDRHDGRCGAESMEFDAVGNVRRGVAHYTSQ
jgi:hypothetical protein